MLHGMIWGSHMTFIQFVYDMEGIHMTFIQFVYDMEGIHMTFIQFVYDMEGIHMTFIQFVYDIGLAQICRQFFQQNIEFSNEKKLLANSEQNIDFTEDPGVFWQFYSNFFGFIGPTSC